MGVHCCLEGSGVAVEEWEHLRTETPHDAKLRARQSVLAKMGMLLVSRARRRLQFCRRDLLSPHATTEYGRFDYHSAQRTCARSRSKLCSSPDEGFTL